MRRFWTSYCTAQGLSYHCRFGLYRYNGRAFCTIALILFHNGYCLKSYISCIVLFMDDFYLHFLPQLGAIVTPQFISLEIFHGKN